MEKTPSSGKSLEELVERAWRMATRYAEVSPYRLNPDQDIWQGVVRAIGRNAYTFGWPYCP
jgi:ferredoxin-thioredoxin reductase catalytic subunit